MANNRNNRRKDVYPQYMSFNIVESGLNTLTTQRIQLPIARRPGAKKITVIEVVEIGCDIPNSDGGNGDQVTVALTFRDETTMPTYSDPNVFFRYNFLTAFVTSGSTIKYMPYLQRYDTGGGKGFLVATDSIFVMVQGTSQASALTAHFKILYRFVEVGLEEYIGVVQQQSAQN